MAKRKVSEKSLANLKKFDSETGAIAGRKGGPRAVEARNEKRTMRQLLQQALYFRTVDGEKNPLTGTYLTNAESIILSLILKARDGDVQAIKHVAELAGELEKKAEVENNIVINVSET